MSLISMFLMDKKYVTNLFSDNHSDHSPDWLTPNKLFRVVATEVGDHRLVDRKGTDKASVL